jgi:hypothetical protein
MWGTALSGGFSAPYHEKKETAGNVTSGVQSPDQIADLIVDVCGIQDRLRDITLQPMMKLAAKPVDSNAHGALGCLEAIGDLRIATFGSFPEETRLEFVEFG